MSKSSSDGAIVHDTDPPVSQSEAYYVPGHSANFTQLYWAEMLGTWLPLILILAFYFGARKKGLKRYEEMAQAQQKAIQQLENMNKLLVEISQKLDKK